MKKPHNHASYIRKTGQNEHCINAIFSAKKVRANCREDLNEFEELILEEHNNIRQLYPDLPTLCYANSNPAYNITFNAQKWVETITNTTNETKLDYLPHSPLALENKIGENLGKKFNYKGGVETVTSFVRNWFDPCQYVLLDMIDAQGIKEFDLRSCVQILWKNTKYINCGLKMTPVGQLITACQYFPSMILTSDKIKMNLVSLTGRESYIEDDRVYPFNFSRSALQVRATQALHFRLSFIENNRLDDRSLLELKLDPQKYSIDFIRFCDSQLLQNEKTRSYVKRGDVLYAIKVDTIGLEILANGATIYHIDVEEIKRVENCLENWISLVSSGSGGFKILLIGYSSGAITTENWFRPLPASDLATTDIYSSTKIADVFNDKEDIKRQVDDSQATDQENDYVSESFVTENYVTDYEEGGDDGSESKKFNEDRHFVITDKEGKKWNVTFPLIHVSFTERKDHAAKAFIDAYEDFKGIEKFQLILQQGEHKGILTAKDKLYNWSDAKKSYEEEGLLLPYITAELGEFGNSPLEFIVGDKMTYGGYYNGELVDDTRPYTLRLRGIVKDKNHEKIIIDTDVIGEIERTQQLTMISAGGASVFLIIIIGFIVSHFIRKRREKRRVANTIAKFNEMLAGDGPQATSVARNPVQSLEIPKSKSGQTSNSSEWWTQDELDGPGKSAVQGGEYRDQYDHQYGEESYPDQQYGEQYQGEQEDIAFSAQYSAVEAASRLLSENDKNIVKRRGTGNAFEGGYS